MADQDDDALGGTRTLTHMVTNYPTVTSAADVTVTVSDDDTAGVTITPTTLAVTEGGEQTYTVVLDTAPAGAVTVAVTLGSGATAPITVTPLSLSFNSTTWSTAQTVTVTATEDDDALDGTRTLTHTVTNYPTVTSAADVTVTVSDNDTAGVTITPTTLAVTEGGEQTYTVVLDTAPAGTVTVAIALGSGATAPITVTPRPLNFTSTTWSTAQTVTVTADQDDDALGGTRTLTHTVTNYPTVTSAANVTVTVSDDDMAGVILSTTTLGITEGADGSYTVALASEPAGTVVVSISADSGTAPPITFSPASLSFSPTTWSDTQTVTVTATEDDDAAGGTRTLSHTVTNYPTVTSAADVTVMVTDNETAGVTLSTTTLGVMEGADGSYTVVLASEPTGTVVVSISADSGTAPPITFSPASLSFSPTTWSDTQTVTVAADRG